MKRLFRRIFFFSLILWLIAVSILIGIIHVTGMQDQAQPSDVLIVLGAGLNRNGTAGQALTRRSQHAADLWLQGYADTIICTGGVAQRQTRSEAEGCRDVLVANGVPESAIILENMSRSTEENAINSQVIIQENNWTTALVVSDGYHVFRANYIFSRYGLNVVFSPVQYERMNSVPFYSSAILREVAAFHWQIFKDAFNIPVTYIPIG